MEQLQTLYLDRSHAVGGTGQYFVLIMYFLVNASPTKPLDVATLNFVPDLALESRWFCATFHVTLKPQFKVKGQIMYFLVNALSLKRIDVAASNCVPD